MAGLKTQTKKISAGQWESEHDNTMNKKSQPSTGQKKIMH